MSDHTTATTSAKSAPIILCGPQAVGKTRHAESIANAFGCERIADDWNGRDELRDGTLAITNAEYTMPKGGLGIHVEDAEGIDTLLAVLGRPVFLGARGTPETLRTFVCKVTNFH